MTKYNLTCEYCGKNTGSLNSVCKECHNKINSDHSSKNCKMDAFKPNRLRPGIFHDAFSRNMSHPNAEIFNKELKKIQRRKNKQLDDEYQGKASFDED